MNTSSNSNSSSKKSGNPLYVVRKNGVDVEEASGLLELILKKTGLDKMIPILESFVQILFSEVQSWAIFIEVKKMFDLIFNKVIEIIFQIQQMTQKRKI